MQLEIEIYLIVINVITFFAYGIDKKKAIDNKWRISESRLIGLAMLGGSVGALCGIHIFHHKVRKPKFYIGVPVILIIQIVFCIYILLT